MRLDIYITNSKMYETRNKSKTAILSGYIYVNNELINKPNYLVKDTDIVEKKQQEEYVSRGAYKLLKAIEE
jgi:23S rRNA (cytidine1920-2'-O)/16S rRNA (cytidine1409-2'-O)-methyltransferase